MVLHQQVPESREAQGLRHRQATVLAIAFAFLLSGGEGGRRAIALFARDLTPTQRANLRCWFNPRTRRYDVPAENCFYRVLKAVPVLVFQQALWAWQKARLGAAVLGILRRAVQGEARAWIRRQPRARDRTTPTFPAKMSRRLGDVLRLITCPGGL